MKQVKKIYDNVSRCIQYQKDELLSNMPGLSAIPSWIQNYCQCIPEHSTTPGPLTQVLLVQASLILALLIQPTPVE